MILKESATAHGFYHCYRVAVVYCCVLPVAFPYHLIIYGYGNAFVREVARMQNCGEEHCVPLECVR